MNLKLIKQKRGVSIAMVVLVLLGTMAMSGFRPSAGEAGNTTATTKAAWVDLVTPDLNKSMAFYKSLFGWSFTEVKINGLRNVLIKKGNTVLGSIFEIKQAKTSVWMPAASVSAQDLESKTSSLISRGAKVAIGSLNIPGRGKQVVFEGAQGEEFSLIADNNYHNQSKRSKDEGTWMGSELWSTNPEKAINFYEFAFNVNASQEDFNGKPYWFFLQNNERLAGMIQNPINQQGSQWVPYVWSANPSRLSDQVENLGGYVIAAPSQSLREGQVAVVQDPNGAIFCIHTN